MVVLSGGRVVVGVVRRLVVHRLTARDVLVVVVDVVVVVVVVVLGDMRWKDMLCLDCWTPKKIIFSGEIKTQDNP